MEFTLQASFELLGIYLETFYFGIYSGIFSLYLYSISQKNTNLKTSNFIFYLLCILYVSSLGIVVLDAVGFIYNTSSSLNVQFNVTIGSATLAGCCDFISQSILIYRCWIVWGCNVRVVIIPSILGITFLATWLVGLSAFSLVPGQIIYASWGYSLVDTSLIISMTVNALVTGLIVFRILKVLGNVQTSSIQSLGFNARRALPAVIFILFESGIALFSLQLARLLVTVVQTDAAAYALGLIVGIQEMLNGITPTIILVRVSMGLSFYNEKSFEKVSGSLHFASGSSDWELESSNTMDNI